MATSEEWSFSRWTEPGAEADNALASASHAGEAGNHHYATKVSASYSDGATSGLLEVKDGGTVVLRRHVHGDAEIDLEKPLRAGEGNALSAELAASGSAGTTGVVSLAGFTMDR